jgi:hypothetical protein
LHVPAEEWPRRGPRINVRHDVPRQPHAGRAYSAASAK